MKRLLILLTLAGCAQIPQTPDKASNQIDENKVYKLDLDLEVNKQKSIGLISVPKAQSYEIKIKAPSDIDLLSLATCAREEVFRKLDDEFRIKFTPKPLEMDRKCIIYLQAYALKFRYMAAIIAIKPDDGASAVLDCDSYTGLIEKQGVCQSRFGVYYTIEFMAPFEQFTPSNPNCHKLEVKENKGIGKLSKGECVYLFRSEDKFLELYTYGYEEFSIYR